MRSSLFSIALACTGFAMAENPISSDLAITDLRLHDPSSIVTEGKESWLFATGNGINSFHSRDLKRWEPGPPVFNQPLPWFNQVADSQRGHLWAPDIVKVGGTHFLYYSVSAFGKQTSAIALATNLSLDPSDRRFAWKDRGIVLQSKRGDPYNAIDPSLLLDGDRLWMSFGSFWDGIFLIELDRPTGLLKDPGAKPVRIAFAPEIEAPFLHKHGAYYYLFVNWGLCCRGAKSTYEIRVGRSKTAMGPYLDRDGNNLTRGGGSLLLETRGDFVGPGHASIVVDRKGQERLACHYYDASRRGASFLAMPKLEWTDDAWPRVSVKEKPTRP